jgi:signal peptidase I
VAVSAAELRSVKDELRWAVSVAAAAATFWLGGAAVLSGGLVSVTAVPSESMAPGVHRGDLMLVDRRKSSAAAAGVGDVILFAPPPNLIKIAEENGTPLGSREFFVKRVVAVEGDVVEAVNGALYRNGTQETPYVTGTPVGVSAPMHNGQTLSICNACKPGEYKFGPSRVPPGSVLVLGDNRGGSNDGHVWGYLPRDYILGRIDTRLGPLDRAGRLQSEPRGEVVSK